MRVVMPPALPPPSPLPRAAAFMSPAAPSLAPIAAPPSLTLVGRDGRYDLIRDGGASEKPALAGLTIAEVIALLQSAEGEP